MSGDGWSKFDQEGTYLLATWLSMMKGVSWDGETVSDHLQVLVMILMREGQGWRKEGEENWEWDWAVNGGCQEHHEKVCSEVALKLITVPNLDRHFKLTNWFETLKRELLSLWETSHLILPSNSIPIDYQNQNRFQNPISHIHLLNEPSTLRLLTRHTISTKSITNCKSDCNRLLWHWDSLCWGLSFFVLPSLSLHPSRHTNTPNSCLLHTHIIPHFLA